MIAPRKILAIKLRSLGDTVLMTAPLAELRRAYPDAEIHVAVHTPWAPLLQGHPAVDKVWSYDRHKETTSRAKALARLALQLRKEHYDVVVNFHASPSSSTLAFATGAKVRSIHFHGHKDRNRYSTVVVAGKGELKPIIERDMDAVRALGINSPTGLLPKIYPTEIEIKEAHARDQKLGLSGPVLAIGIGASRPTKSWPVERFSEVAVSWCQKTKGSVICFISHDETELARDFQKGVDDTLTQRFQNLAERANLRAKISCEMGLPLRSLAASLANSALFLGNDSGPKHMAVALGTPSVTVFGPEDPFEWHPYPRENHAIAYIEGLPCRRDADQGMRPWCGIHICIEEKHRCMTEITVEQVLGKCLSHYSTTGKLSVGTS